MPDELRVKNDVTPSAPLGRDARSSGGANPRRWIRLGLIVTVGLIGFWMHWGQHASSRKDLLARNLHVGEVWETDSLPWTLTVANSGDETVEVVGLATSCTCVSHTQDPFVLSPGAEREVSLLLDLTRANTLSFADEKRPFALEVVPLIKGAVASPTWTLHGIVKRAVSYKSASLNLGEMVTSSKALITKEFPVSVDARVASLEAVYDSNLAKVTVRRESVHGNYLIQVTPVSAVGEFSFPITIRTIGRHGDVFAVSKIRAHGSIVPEIQCFPRSLMLGTLKQASGWRERITLRSVLGRPVHVEAIESIGGITVTRVTANGAVSQVFQITGRAGGERDQEETVCFHCKDGDQEAATVRLIVSYFSIR